MGATTASGTFWLPSHESHREIVSNKWVDQPSSVSTSGTNWLPFDGTYQDPVSNAWIARPSSVTSSTPRLEKEQHNQGTLRGHGTWPADNMSKSALLFMQLSPFPLAFLDRVMSPVLRVTLSVSGPMAFAAKSTSRFALVVFQWIVIATASATSCSLGQVPLSKVQRMSTASKSKSEGGSKKADSPTGSGRRGSSPGDARNDSANNKAGIGGGSASGSRESPAGSDKKPSPAQASPKSSPPKKAMQKKYLQCHYTPFAFVCGICMMMVMMLYIQIYYPDVWEDTLSNVAVSFHEDRLCDQVSYRSR
ncbi:hypothetical protein HPB50_007291 [Hyalomma asiaticum]|uniref:Uncharacterized protein n=1 Tax=Hyalomma asiaticum TaxID=266040 RepID=A0ACB7RKX9_HYAAI|nr:hypothetical protein HPB50_007291 [Hyalomma asiaticum]